MTFLRNPYRIKMLKYHPFVFCIHHHRIRHNLIHKTKCYQQINHPMIIGIESSCDDTGIAVVNGNGEILAEAIENQVDIHSKWGGIVPKLACKAHENVIHQMVTNVIEASKVDPRELDAVAVTIGPGLSLCLKVGIMKAKMISYEYGIPFMSIHHMEAHALMPCMENKVQIKHPFLCLLISGGHNLLLIVNGVGRYIEIGTTLDDSIGEAYDKVARLLDLELKPCGGVVLEKLAESGNQDRFEFKLPMQKYSNCDFSYSGLKTSVRMTLERENISSIEDSKKIKADIAASFQKIAVEHLCDKCNRGISWALENYPEIDHFVISGGVASNKYIRKSLIDLSQKNGLIPCFPPSRLCTDNGVMVAWAGIERYKMGLYNKDNILKSLPNENEWIDIRPRWPLTEKKAFFNQNPRLPKKKRIHQSLTDITEEELSKTKLSISTHKF